MTETSQASNSTGSQVAMLVDICKLTRCQWLTRPQIAQHLGSKTDTVAKWTAEMVAQGLLLERMGERAAGVRGHSPMVYRLAPQWGGQAKAGRAAR